MTVYYTNRSVDSHNFLLRVLGEFYGIHAPEIETGKHGKPYLCGNPLFFNLSHSGNMTALAVSATEVGLDIQLRDNRPHEALFRRLTPAEREEDFYRLWTAKEAYVKYRGETLINLLRRLVYEKGGLYLDNARVPESFTFAEREDCVFCVCTARPQPIDFYLL